MVKGRRKRVPASSSDDNKSSMIQLVDGSILSPLKKEMKLVLEDNDVENKGKNPSAKSGRMTKSPVCITSYFSSKTNEKRRNACKPQQHQEIKNCIESGEVIFESKSDVETKRVHTSPDIELCKTDETQVAVPSSDPPTPHRINLPKLENDDSNTKDLSEGSDKKSLAISQRIANQSETGKFGRGRGKLKFTPMQLSNNNGLGSNHKVTEYFPVRRSVRRTKKTVLEEKQRDLEDKVLCQVENGLEVKHFIGKGRGIVTTREFSKGEFVVEYIGELIDQITAKKREAEYANDQNTGCYMYYFQHRGHQYCVDATAESDKLGRLVNHSRNGNLIARIIEIDSIPHLVLTAKENIKTGVEVAYDYGDRSREAIRHHPWLAL